MGELFQVEVGAEFAIDAGEDIQVERGSHASGIVVGEQLNFNTFFEIGAEEQGIARFENGANWRRKASAAGRSKFPMVLREKERKRVHRVHGG